MKFRQFIVNFSSIIETHFILLKQSPEFPSLFYTFVCVLNTS